MDILPIGSKVIIRDDIKAFITGILIRANDHIQYECTYWNGDSRNCAWLEDMEVNPDGAIDKKHVGFLHPSLVG